MTIEEKLNYLRNQKANPTAGGYRQLLIATYDYLREILNKTGFDWCNPYNIDVCKAVYGNTYHVPLIQRYIRDLKQLGYISIDGKGESRKIRIIKAIDF